MSILTLVKHLIQSLVHTKLKMASYRNNSQKTAEDAYDIIHEIKHVERKFRRARTQLIVLTNRIDSLLVRYERSKRQEKEHFCYSTKMQMSTLEGVKIMFFEYASKLGDDMDVLQMRLVRLTGEGYDDFDEY